MESHEIQQRINDAVGVKALRASLGLHLSTIYEWAQDPADARFGGKPRSCGPLDTLRIMIAAAKAENSDDGDLAAQHVGLFVSRLCKRDRSRRAPEKAELIALAIRANREAMDTLEVCSRTDFTDCDLDRLTTECLQARDVLDQLIEMADAGGLRVSDVKHFPTKPKLDTAS